MPRLVCWVLALFFCANGIAQTQRISGRVVDGESLQPLPGVNVVVATLAEITGASTDAEGYYSIAAVPIGRHTLHFSFIGYERHEVANLVLTSGKEAVVNAALQPSAVMMDAVEVEAAAQGQALNEMAVLSARPFEITETERYAGSRGEPSRMASNFAGVQGADDSRNDIVVRGNSPMAILWRLEDLPISNPNHFNIPGTAGGSISLLNNKTLANSDFYTGAFPAEFGNANAAVFDLNLRAGNANKHEFTGQFGFLGLEAMAEGPLNKSTHSTYLAAYRYSTLALLGGMGIDYGTSAIPRYQDGTFYLHFPGKGARTISVFGLAGTSDIDILISNQETPEERNLYGDQDRDQFFGTDMAVVGASLTQPLGKNAYAKLSAGFNHVGVNTYHELIYRHVNAEGRYVVDSTAELLRYQFTENKAIAHAVVNAKGGNGGAWRAGLVAEQFFFHYADSTLIIDSAQSDVGRWRSRWNSRTPALLLQAYAQWKKPWTQRLTTVAGWHAQWFGLNGSLAAVEPRLAARLSTGPRTQLTAGGGLHSQCQPYYMYFFRNSAAEGLSNYRMDFTRAAHAVAGYEWQARPHLRLKTEVYVQHLWQIPVERRASSFSLANTGSGFERFFVDSLVNGGIQRNAGIELTVEKSFAQHVYWLLTASLFDSRYRGSDQQWRSTDFNGNYAVNALVGYEWKLGKSNTIGIGIKATTTGGRRYGPADLARSNATRELVVIDSLRNSLQFSPYRRVDFKVNYARNARRSHHEVGIDLVNAFDVQNVLGLTYAPAGPADPDAIREEYQLGRLPLFYYRVGF